MQSFSEGLLRDAVLSGTICLPGPGSAVEPFLDADDIAAVAVAALTEPGHDGVVHELTGPDPISLDEAADAVDRVLGRPATTFAAWADRAAAQGSWDR